MVTKWSGGGGGGGAGEGTFCKGPEAGMSL